MTDPVPGPQGTPGTPAPAVTPGSVPAAPSATPAAPAAAPAIPATQAAPTGPAEAFNTPWKDVKDGVWQIDGKPWWTGIPEAPVRELAEAKRYANPYEQAMAYYNANKLVSGAADAVVIPKADASPEVIAEFRKKMGVPEKVEDYKFQHAEGVQVDPTMEAFGKKLFHKMGVPPEQAQLGVNEWNTFMGEMQAAHVAQQQTKNDTELAQLETRWGPELKTNLAAGNEVLKVVGLPEALVARVEEHIGSAAVVEMLAMIGKATPGGSFKGNGGGGSGEVSGPAAQAEINKLMADPAYTDKTNPQHRDLVDKVARLFAKV